MGKQPVIETMAIPVMLEKAKTEGITESTEGALEFEELKAQEEIEGLRKRYHEGLISHDQMKANIKVVREKLQQLLIDNGILT